MRHAQRSERCLLRGRRGAQKGCRARTTSPPRMAGDGEPENELRLSQGTSAAVAHGVARDACPSVGLASTGRCRRATADRHGVPAARVIRGQVAAPARDDVRRWRARAAPTVAHGVARDAGPRVALATALGRRRTAAGGHGAPAARQVGGQVQVAPATTADGVGQERGASGGGSAASIIAELSLPAEPSG